MADKKKPPIVPAVNIAKGSPAVGVPLAVGRLGERVIQATPRRLRDEISGAVRKVGRFAGDVARRIRSRARVAAHGARKAANRAARR